MSYLRNKKVLNKETNRYSKIHIFSCDICGGEFSYKHRVTANRKMKEKTKNYCSRSCQWLDPIIVAKMVKNMLLTKSKKLKEDPLYWDKMVEKTRKTNEEKYGDPNYNNMDKNKQTKLKNHGDENYNNREKYKVTCLDKFGYENPSYDPRIKKIIGDKASKRLINNPELVDKMTTTGGYINGKYTSTKTGEEHYYDSSWELKRMNHYDSNSDVVYWTRCRKVVPYFDTIKLKDRNHFPDFRVEYNDGRVNVEEVKGQVTQNTVDKYKEAIKYFELLGWSYIVLTLTSTHKNEWRQMDFDELLTEATKRGIVGQYSTTKRSKQKQ